MDLGQEWLIKVEESFWQEEEQKAGKSYPHKFKQSP
jgi:hypothetical protein